VIEAQLDDELDGTLPLPDDDVDVDLADVAAAHPVEHVRLDLARIDVRETLTIGDVSDMARELGTEPAKLQSVLTKGSGFEIDVTVVLAWILGRKGDPTLSLDHVRRFWQIELVGVGTAKPDPTGARRATTPRSARRRGSSRKRG